jgi:hypothetical protein
MRYYIRVADKIEWADRPEDLMQHLPRLEDLPPGFELPRPISVTFIPATVFDNPALLRVNPEYLAWLPPCSARKLTALPNSPPTENPCSSRARVRIIGAATPIVA